MKWIADKVSGTYKTLLRLYPNRFQADYGEEMVVVFRKACIDSAKTSGWAVCKLGLRELRDLPTSLIREHVSEIWRGARMNTHLNPQEPWSKSILRGIFSFCAGFTLFYLIYCLVDTFLNPGVVFGRDSIFWTLSIRPTALAYGFGALIIGLKYGKRKAWLSALGAFIVFTLFYRLWAVTYLTLWRILTYSPLGTLLAHIFYNTITGLLVGGVIGWIQQGWKKAGWYALAGILGFNLGWVIEYPISIYLIQHSPYGADITHLVIGSPWYFMYMVIPMIIFGGIVGTSLGMITAWINRRVPSIH